jgi:transcriptional regulator with XRE-family HTH domain
MIFFSKNLKYLRKQRGIDQRELADSIGVKSNTISNYENGVSQPDYTLLETLKKFFNVDVEILLYDDLSLGIEKSRNLTSESGDPNLIRYFSERIETLSAENALLKREVVELKSQKKSETFADVSMVPKL